MLLWQECARDLFLSPASQQHPPLLDCDDGTCTATLLFLRSDCNNKKRHSSSHGRLDRRTGTDQGWRGWEGRMRDQRDATTVSDVTPAVARIISIASQSPVPLSTGGSRKSTRKLRCASPFHSPFIIWGLTKPLLADARVRAAQSNLFYTKPCGRGWAGN